MYGINKNELDKVFMSVVAENLKILDADELVKMVENFEQKNINSWNSSKPVVEELLRFLRENADEIVEKRQSLLENRECDGDWEFYPGKNLEGWITEKDWYRFLKENPRGYWVNTSPQSIRQYYESKLAPESQRFIYDHFPSSDFIISWYFDPEKEQLLWAEYYLEEKKIRDKWYYLYDDLARGIMHPNTEWEDFHRELSGIMKPQENFPEFVELYWQFHFWVEMLDKMIEGEDTRPQITLL